MSKTQSRLNFVRALTCTSALVAIGFMVSPALAQQSTGTTAAPATDEDTVVVVGTRASQQTSIDRKKKAKTATDSIVAEDVGSFPDKNIGEAISRIAGVALNRGDFGEGQDVTIRGAGPDLNRVELDGLGVLNTGGGQRGNEFRDLNSDLIKSVDVVKGTTADMTEGSLGGMVRIQTRTALDFKKPYISLRYGLQNMTLSNDWTPDINLVASRKFFNNRLGVLLNVNYSDVETQGHMARVSNNQSTYFRLADFDNSLEKTFSFNPSTATDTANNIVFANSTETPLSLITKSAAAKTKADCYAAFPVTVGTTAQRNQKVSELLTCLNQWNDYTPSLPRYSMWRRADQRSTVDLRFDYRVNDDMTVFVKGTMNKRYIDYQDHNYSIGTPTAAQTVNTTTGVLTQTSNITASTVDASHHVTSFTLDNTTGWGVDARDFYQDIETRYYQTGGQYKKNGWLVDFMAGRSESDFVMEQNGIGFGAVAGGITAKITPSGLWSYTLPAGVDQNNPAYYLTMRPAVASAAVAANYFDAAIPAYTAAQRPQYSSALTLWNPATIRSGGSSNYNYTPQIQENSENTFKVDVTKDLYEGKFFTRFKGGVSLREYNGKGWGNGGYTPDGGSGVFGQANYVPPVVVPGAFIRSFFQACQPTATSTVPCNYGVTTVPNSFNSSTTLTPAQYQAMVAASLTPLPYSFFKGYPDRQGLLNGWYTVDVQKALSFVDTSHFNLDCVKVCKGSDGKMYEQPYSNINEKTTAAYFMAEFEQPLPFGLEINGNVGGRFVRSENTGVGYMTIQQITKNPGWNNTTVAGFNDVTTRNYFNANTVTRVTQDWLPSYNLALVAFDGKLFFRAYSGKVVARPPTAQMLPTGTCVFDQRADDMDPSGNDVLQNCTARVGNPGLKPYTALNRNYSIEWYPNKDTQVSIGRYENDVRIGAPINWTLTNVDLFGNGIIFDSVPTYINGPAGPQKGWEFATKSAFTFLPWYLKYTGADFNYAKASANSLSIVDPTTGTRMPPQFQSSYFINFSLWYDDGKLQAKAAYQARDYFFDSIAFGAAAGTPTNNYPGTGYGNVRLPYNPGSPYYRDKTEYLDAKISYKFANDVQIFAEGRNLMDQGASRSQGDYVRFSDGTPSILELSYPGRRYIVGVTVRR